MNTATPQSAYRNQAHLRSLNICKRTNKNSCFVRLRWCSVTHYTYDVSGVADVPSALPSATLMHCHEDRKQPRQPYSLLRCCGLHLGYGPIPRRALFKCFYARCLFCVLGCPSADTVFRQTSVNFIAGLFAITEHFKD